MMPPAPLPDRRPHWGELFEWAGVTWLGTVSLGCDGNAGEVFIDPAGSVADVDERVLGLVHEAAFTASHLLQAEPCAGVMARRLDP